MPHKVFGTNTAVLHVMHLEHYRLGTQYLFFFGTQCLLAANIIINIMVTDIFCFLFLPLVLG